MTRSPESYSSRSALLQSLPLGSEFFESDCPIQGPACLRRAEGSEGLFIWTIGIARAKTKMGLANLVYNIKRLLFLRRIAAA
jgi:hypothetical protein